MHPSFAARSTENQRGRRRRARAARFRPRSMRRSCAVPVIVSGEMKRVLEMGFRLRAEMTRTTFLVSTLTRRSASAGCSSQTGESIRTLVNLSFPVRTSFLARTSFRGKIRCRVRLGDSYNRDKSRVCHRFRVTERRKPRMSVHHHPNFELIRAGDSFRLLLILSNSTGRTTTGSNSAIKGAFQDRPARLRKVLGTPPLTLSISC